MFDDFSDENLSDSDDELELMLREPRQKNEGYFDIIPVYSEQVFFEHFRLSRQVVNNIADTFRNSHLYGDHVGQYGNTSALDQILLFLWYTGHQTASFGDVGDRFNVSISSVNRILRRVTLFLSNMSPLILKWPEEAEKQASEEHFARNGFPSIIGAIDGTHIKIDKPGEDSESYINRKGYYSIHMQAICDHRRRITDVFVGYPGSVHDSRVFKNSSIGRNLEQKCGRYKILGDSGYPVKPNLLTPYKDRGNLTERQLNYNLKLARNRYIIEHCFGILKQKFRQLYHLKLRDVRFIVHFIRAACVLHNIGIDDDNFLDNMEQDVVQDLDRFQNQAEVIENDEDEVEDRDATIIRDNVAAILRM